MADETPTITIHETGQAHQSLPRLMGSLPITPGTSGVLYLANPPTQDEGLTDYLDRQQRNLEWIALKAWWASTRVLKRAEASGRRHRITEAHRQRHRVIEVYGSSLKRARVKWRRAKRERDERRRHLTRPL